MLELEYPSSPSLRYQHFWLLDVRLRLKYITTFPVLQFADGRQWDFLASVIVWANSYWCNKSLLPYMYPVGFVSLENPDTQALLISEDAQISKCHFAVWPPPLSKKPECFTVCSSWMLEPKLGSRLALRVSPLAIDQLLLMMGLPYWGRDPE